MSENMNICSFLARSCATLVTDILGAGLKAFSFPSGETCADLILKTWGHNAPVILKVLPEAAVTLLLSPFFVRATITLRHYSDFKQCLQFQWHFQNAWAQISVS